MVDAWPGPMYESKNERSPHGVRPRTLLDISLFIPTISKYLVTYCFQKTVVCWCPGNILK